MSLPRHIMHHGYRLLVKWARFLHVYLTLFGFALLLFFAVTGFMLNHEDWFRPLQTTRGKLPRELLDKNPRTLLENEDDRSALFTRLQEDFNIVGELASCEFEETEDAICLRFKAERDEGTSGSIKVVIKRADGETLVSHDKTGVTEHFLEGTIPKEMYDPWAEDKKLPIVEKLRAEFAVKGKMGDFIREKESGSLRVDFKAPGYSAVATISTEDGKIKVKHEEMGVAHVLLDLHRNKNSGEAWGFVVDGVSILFVIVSITGLILWTSLRARAQHGLAIMALGLALGLAIYYYYVPR